MKDFGDVRTNLNGMLPGLLLNITSDDIKRYKMELIMEYKKRYKMEL